MSWISELNGTFFQFGRTIFTSFHFISRLFCWFRCHGEEGNCVYELARDKNLLSSCKFKWEIFDFMRTNGEAIPQSISHKLSHLGLHIYESSDFTAEALAYNGSMGNFFADK